MATAGGLSRGPSEEYGTRGRSVTTARGPCQLITSSRSMSRVGRDDHSVEAFLTFQPTKVLQ